MLDNGQAQLLVKMALIAAVGETPVTAAELASDPHSDFHGFCEWWRVHGRAPLAGADWLEERGMDGQAAAWAWAANEPDRHTESHSIHNYDGKSDGGFCPYGHGATNGFIWWRSNNRKWRATLPVSVSEIDIDSDTFASAIAWFLDRWATVFGTSRTPVATQEVATV